MSELKTGNHDVFEDVGSLPKKSLFLYPDDLEPGQLLCIHSRSDDEDFPGAGHALKVLAVQLPFVVVKPLGNPCYPPAIFNVADFRLMKISEQFARAQDPEPPLPHMSPEWFSLAQPRGEFSD